MSGLEIYISFYNLNKGQERVNNGRKNLEWISPYTLESAMSPIQD